MGLSNESKREGCSQWTLRHLYSIVHSCVANQRHSPSRGGEANTLINKGRQGHSQSTEGVSK